MKPLYFIIGIITVIYVITEWIGGKIQYSIEGYVGSGLFDIITFFDKHFISRGLFMNLVYVATLLFGIILVWIGMKRGKK